MNPRHIRALLALVYRSKWPYTNYARTRNEYCPYHHELSSVSQGLSSQYPTDTDLRHIIVEALLSLKGRRTSFATQLRFIIRGYRCSMFRLEAETDNDTCLVGWFRGAEK